MSDPLRSAVIAEAATWLRTPYHHMGRLKGVGCDCLTLLAEVYGRVGAIPRIVIPYYPPDWHLHRGVERYMDGLLNYAREIEAAGPGDVALFRFGRCYSHGAIVTDWPRLIHAWHAGGVMRSDATQPLLAGRAVRFFSPFPAADGLFASPCVTPAVAGAHMPGGPFAAPGAGR
jgi:NlpC/P60 family putative phage cell wall peptidase